MPIVERKRTPGHPQPASANFDVYPSSTKPAAAPKPDAKVAPPPAPPFRPGPVRKMADVHQVISPPLAPKPPQTAPAANPAPKPKSDPPPAAMAPVSAPFDRKSPALIGPDGQVIAVANQRHKPIRLGMVGPVQFHRCPCGFTLALYDGRLFWIPAAAAIRGIDNLEDLTFALSRSCNAAARLEATARKAAREVAAQPDAGARDAAGK